MVVVTLALIACAVAFFVIAAISRPDAGAAADIVPARRLETQREAA